MEKLNLLKKWFRDSRGLTLVELLVAMAIIGFVMAGLAAIMNLTGAFFNQNTDEVDLQNEAQDAFNQLQNILIDATDGIGYDDTNHILYAFTEEGYTKIALDSVNSTLRYSQYTFLNPINADTTLTIQAAAGLSRMENETIDNVLMASYVTGFEVNIWEEAGEADEDTVGENIRSVVISLTLVEGDNTFSDALTVSLRNRVPYIE